VNQTDSSDLKSLASCIEPFDLVKVDLEQTKMFAIENILQTSYEKLREASHYNLLLKGKNFRSAILFLLAKAIYYSQNSAAGKDLLPFEKTEMYDKVTCLAACIEIAHNASLLQDDIIDHADNRRGR
jgi:geranyl diphosphate synthase